MQRYRECHDLYHCITNFSVNVESELAVKYFEFANLGLPLAAISAIGGPLRLLSPSEANKRKRDRLFSEYVPWALRYGSTARCLISVYWEKRWEQNVEELRKELGIRDSPARWSKSKKALETEASLTNSNSGSMSGNETGNETNASHASGTVPPVS